MGIAYPGVIIESCCAIGSVDMSDAFAYINDNGVKTIKEVWNSGMDLGIYIVQWLAIADEIKLAKAQGEKSFSAYFDAIWSKIVDLPARLNPQHRYTKGSEKLQLGRFGRSKLC